MNSSSPNNSSPTPRTLDRYFAHDTLLHPTPRRHTPSLGLACLLLVFTKCATRRPECYLVATLIRTLVDPCLVTLMRAIVQVQQMLSSSERMSPKNVHHLLRRVFLPIAMQSHYHTINMESGTRSPAPTTSRARMAWAVAAGTSAFVATTYILSATQAQTALFAPTATRPAVVANQGVARGMPLQTNTQPFAFSGVAMRASQDSVPIASVTNIPHEAERSFGAFAPLAALAASVVGLVLAISNIRQPQRLRRCCVLVAR